MERRNKVSEGWILQCILFPTFTTSDKGHTTPCLVGVNPSLQNCLLYKFYLSIKPSKLAKTFNKKQGKMLFFVHWTDAIAMLLVSWPIQPLNWNISTTIRWIAGSLNEFELNWNRWNFVCTFTYPSGRNVIALVISRLFHQVKILTCPVVWLQSFAWHSHQTQGHIIVFWTARVFEKKKCVWEELYRIVWRV